MASNRFPQLAPTVFITALVAASCAILKCVDEGAKPAHAGNRVESPVRAELEKK